MNSTTCFSAPLVGVAGDEALALEVVRRHHADAADGLAAPGFARLSQEHALPSFRVVVQAGEPEGQPARRLTRRRRPSCSGISPARPRRPWPPRASMAPTGCMRAWFRAPYFFLMGSKDWASGWEALPVPADGYAGILQSLPEGFVVAGRPRSCLSPSRGGRCPRCGGIRPFDGSRRLPPPRCGRWRGRWP